MTREEMIERLIQADTSAILEMDYADQWEAVSSLVEAVYEKIGDAELKIRYANLQEIEGD